MPSLATEAISVATKELNFEIIDKAVDEIVKKVKVQSGNNIYLIAETRQTTMLHVQEGLNLQSELQLHGSLNKNSKKGKIYLKLIDGRVTIATCVYDVEITDSGEAKVEVQLEVKQHQGSGLGRALLTQVEKVLTAVMTKLSSFVNINKLLVNVHDASHNNWTKNQMARIMAQDERWQSQDLISFRLDRPIIRE